MRLLVVLVLTLAMARSSRAECPANTVNVLSDTYTTSAPSDTAYRQASDCDVYYCWQQVGRASYDLVAGTMYVNALGANADASSSLFTHDVFTLFGPPSSSPITFAARAHVELSIDCNGVPPSASASIRQGTSNLAETARAQCGDGTTDIGISITCETAATFDLYMTAEVQAGEPDSGGQAEARVSLTFPDLPPGYSLVSCQGYATGPTVATRRESWGALKTLYK